VPHGCNSQEESPTVAPIKVFLAPVLLNFKQDRIPGANEHTSYEQHPPHQQWGQQWPQDLQTLQQLQKQEE